jgi:HAD superfamily hydrolase (TIGR01509 family)
MIKNIIFDFDGVLVDSEILVAKAFSKYMQELGIKTNEKEFANLAGKKTVEVIDILSEKYSLKDKQKFFDDIMNIASNIYKKELKTVVGVEEFLKKSKHNLYIGSNSMKNRILDGLKRVGLEKYFNPNHIYSFDLVDNPKPHPDIYLKAVNDNDLIIDETIIIEDSVVGVNAGKNANIKVIGLTAGGHWHTDRDEKELINAGAIATANNYNKIEEIIESL